MSDIHPQLSAALQQHLRDACAVCQALPKVPELRLFLLNQDYPQGELSSDEVSAIMNYPAYWAFCWASGQVLAHFLLQNPRWVRGKRVLDFGSGSGVAAIAAAKAGAAKVLACDIDADAQLATQVNAQLNGVDVEVFGDFGDRNDPVDIILVADVLYDRSNYAWLARFLERAPQVLVADSRVKNFRFPRYRWLDRQDSCTLPDLDESTEFRSVNLYVGE